jgi:hypothetical protein
MASPPVTIRSKKLKRFLFVGPTGAGKFVYDISLIIKQEVYCYRQVKNNQLLL